MKAARRRPSSKVVGRYIHMYVYSSRVCNAQDESERGSEGVGEGGEARSRLAGWEMRRVRRGIGALMKAGRAQARAQAACSAYPCMSESDNGLPETDAAAAQRENELPLTWKVRRSVCAGPAKGISQERLRILTSLTASHSRALCRGTAMESIERSAPCLSGLGSVAPCIYHSLHARYRAKSNRYINMAQHESCIT